MSNYIPRAHPGYDALPSSGIRPHSYVSGYSRLTWAATENFLAEIPNYGIMAEHANVDNQ